MNFNQSFKKSSILTPDNRKQPQTSFMISLKGIVEFNEIWPLEGALYITLLELLGHPDNISFMQFSQKIYGFRQKGSQGF